MFSTIIKLEWITESKIFHESVPSQWKQWWNKSWQKKLTSHIIPHYPLSVEILAYIILMLMIFHALLLLILLFFLSLIPIYNQPSQTWKTIVQQHFLHKIKKKQQKNWRLWKCYKKKYKKSLKSRGRYFNSFVHSVMRSLFF